MFDIGFFELVVLSVVGLLVLGPERLPHAIRMTGAYMGRIRRAVASVREEFEREVNLHETQQRIKQQMDDAGLEETRQALQQLRQDVEADSQGQASKSKVKPRPQSESQPRPELQPEENRIDGGLTQAGPTPAPDDAPDPRHNPPSPENDPDPFPEPAPAADDESKKA